MTGVGTNRYREGGRDLRENREEEEWEKNRARGENIVAKEKREKRQVNREALRGNYGQKGLQSNN